MNQALRLTALLSAALVGTLLHAQQPRDGVIDAPSSIISSADPRSEAFQPPPRSRYGRIRKDHFHNADGSQKYEFVIGTGLVAPAGNAHHYLIPAWTLQFGGGRDFNKHFGVLLQADYDRFGFNSQTLASQLSIYDVAVTPASPYYISSLNGATHVWSITLNPHYNVMQGDVWGAYVIAGAGYFHKVANFTTPATGAAYSPYIGYYQYSSNEVIDRYTSNAPGFNGGFGVTFRPSQFASERLFAEARYNATVNSQRTGITAANLNSPYGQSYTGSDFYPANSNRTAWIGLKVGVRF